MISGMERMMKLTNGNNIVSIKNSQRKFNTREEERARLQRLWELEFKHNRPMIEVGDKIWALDRTFEVKEVLDCEYLGDRPIDTEVKLHDEFNFYYTVDEWGYDCEFIDTNGGYHSWKQQRDCFKLGDDYDELIFGYVIRKDGTVFCSMEGEK